MFDNQGGLGGSQLGLESLMAEIHERRLRLIMRISFFIRDIYLITMIIPTSYLIAAVVHPHWFCHQREECDRLTGMLELQKQHFKEVLCFIEIPRTDVSSFILYSKTDNDVWRKFSCRNSNTSVGSCERRAYAAIGWRSRWTTSLNYIRFYHTWWYWWQRCF